MKWVYTEDGWNMIDHGRREPAIRPGAVTDPKTRERFDRRRGNLLRLRAEV
jgi:hypothetical protein